MIPESWRIAFEYWAGTERGVRTILVTLAVLAICALVMGLNLR